MNASDLPEVSRLLGVFEWLAGREGAALRWWDHSRTEAERMGALPELARTFAEVAHRLRACAERGRQWNGLGVHELDQRAREWLAQCGLTGEPDR